MPELTPVLMRTNGILAFAVPSTEIIPLASPETPMFLGVAHLSALVALPYTLPNKLPMT